MSTRAQQDGMHLFLFTSDRGGACGASTWERMCAAVKAAYVHAR